MLPNGKNLNNFSQFSLRPISLFILDINSYMGKIGGSVERSQFSLRPISLFILDINSYMGKIGGSVERYVPPMGIR
jgi:hypothetical protein